METNAILTVISVLAAVFAAGGAWKAAKAAEQSMSSSMRSALQAMILEVVQTAKDCEAVKSQIRGLEGDLVGALRVSQAARGIRQDSATDMVLTIASALMSQAEELCRELPDYLPPKVGAMLVNADAAHSALLKLKPIQRDLYEVRDKLHQHISKVKSTHAR